MSVSSNVASTDSESSSISAIFSSPTDWEVCRACCFGSTMVVIVMVVDAVDARPLLYSSSRFSSFLVGDDPVDLQIPFGGRFTIKASSADFDLAKIASAVELTRSFVFGFLPPVYLLIYLELYPNMLVCFVVRRQFQ